MNNYYELFSQFLGLAIGIIAVAVFILVMYLLTLQNVLKEVSDNNRLVPAANVWLMFIPIFSTFYVFYLYPRISNSINAEMDERGASDGSDYGKTLGMTLATLGLVSSLLSYAKIAPSLSGLLSLTNLVLFIIFWSKMAGFKTKLINTPKLEGISSSEEVLD
jgi:magnesium-transporting ATPase (P-type)